MEKIAIRTVVKRGGDGNGYATVRGYVDIKDASLTIDEYCILMAEHPDAIIKQAHDDVTKIVWRALYGEIQQRVCELRALAMGSVIPDRFHVMDDKFKALLSLLGDRHGA